MGKKSGYMPETPVFLGTTNVNQARRQRGWRVGIFIGFFTIDLLFASVRTLGKNIALNNQGGSLFEWCLG